MERLDCRIKYHAIANIAKVALSNLTQQLNSWPKTNAVCTCKLIVYSNKLEISG